MTKLKVKITKKSIIICVSNCHYQKYGRICMNWEYCKSTNFSPREWFVELFFNFCTVSVLHSWLNQTNLLFKKKTYLSLLYKVNKGVDNFVKHLNSGAASKHAAGDCRRGWTTYLQTWHLTACTVSILSIKANYMHVMSVFFGS